MVFARVMELADKHASAWLGQRSAVDAAMEVGRTAVQTLESTLNRASLQALKSAIATLSPAEAGPTARPVQALAARPREPGTRAGRRAAPVLVRAGTREASPWVSFLFLRVFMVCLFFSVPSSSFIWMCFHLTRLLCTSHQSDEYNY